MLVSRFHRGLLLQQRSLFGRTLCLKYSTATDVHQTQPQPNDGAVRWSLPAKTGLDVFADLSKARLAGLVVLTTMAGYAIAPGASAAASVTSLLMTTAGTTLCVASANTLNQWIESPFDAQMSRTKGRPLVKRRISPTRAFLFGVSSGIAGVGVLSLVNPVTCALGAANVLLYAFAYTPMKRISIVNTWIGAVVGAIPPLMGWAAATGGVLDPGAWILGAVLFAWQFPHFNSLAWSLRKEYAVAGYRMMAVTDPGLNARVALRYSALLFPLCCASSFLQVTSPLFMATSSLANALLLFPALQFWKDANQKTARSLFFASLLHLPLILALFMIHKM